MGQTGNQAQQGRVVSTPYFFTGSMGAQAGGNTTFSGRDIANVQLAYTVGFLKVVLNGGELTPGRDFTATDGSTFTILGKLLGATDEIYAEAQAVASLVNTYTQAAADARFVLQSAAPGMLLNAVYAEYTANVDLTAIIPTDNTIPQSNEGTQILSASLTPSSVTSKVRVRFQGSPSASNPTSVSAALFVSSGVNAVRGSTVTIPASGYSESIFFEYQHVPGVTTPQTYSVRFGPNGANTVRLNGGPSSNYLGGVMATTLVVEELKG